MPSIASATGILVGTAVGGGRVDDARQWVRHGLEVNLATMACVDVLYATLASTLHRFLHPRHSSMAPGQRVAAHRPHRSDHQLGIGDPAGGAGLHRDIVVPVLISGLVLRSVVPTLTYGLGSLARLGSVGAWLSLAGETSLRASAFAWRWRPW